MIMNVLNLNMIVGLKREIEYSSYKCWVVSLISILNMYKTFCLPLFEVIVLKECSVSKMN